jgi:SAM-dependent methyltransferase
MAVSSEALVGSRDSRYQNVELPGGGSTGGRDRSPTARAILPADLGGKSVLDVGCRVGYFCFEAVRRGAKRVVGLDHNAGALASASELAARLGMDVEFRLVDANHELPDERFDYVLALNILHHLRDPIGVLERLSAITRERLVLEIAGFGRNDRRNAGISWPIAALLARLPAIYAAPTGLRGRRGVPRFYLSEPALRNLLLRHQRTFARVDTMRSPLKRRYLAVAHKRRIGDLVVVAGPLGAGQGALIERLRRGELSGLAEQIGLDPGAAWQSCRGRDLERLTEPVVPKLLLHYDLPGATLDSGEDPLTLTATAERVTFVTLWCSAEALRRGLDGEELPASVRRGRLFQGRRHQQIRAIYADPTQVDACYQSWLERLRQYPHARHVQLRGDEGRLVSLEPAVGSGPDARGPTSNP